jgi:hypothetical protein
MHTENGIEIRGDIKRIFQVAAQVDKWPEILPHYRWVRVLQRKRRRTTVEMAARRGRIPVSWTAVQEVFPYERITYKHIKGFTTGMDVTWSFKPMQEQWRWSLPTIFPCLGRSWETLSADISWEPYLSSRLLQEHYSISSRLWSLGRSLAAVLRGHDE